MIDTSPSATRGVARIVRGMPTSDGAGVRLTRIIGRPGLPELDPFLLLDEFRSDDPADYLAGFPDHPHRGFETVTYLLAGRMRHRDDQGNAGVLEPGSGQWMTAGRGIVHSEMPEQVSGELRGFQLWVNLPASDKMCAPRYQDIAPDRIPAAVFDGGSVRVLAGAFGGVTGAVTAVATEPTFFDVDLRAGATFASELTPSHAAFVYVADGAIAIGGRDVARGEAAVLTPGERFTAQANVDAARFLLVAGRPLGEPIARYGPIVMNTEDELAQAFEDLRNGTFST